MRVEIMKSWLNVDQKKNIKVYYESEQVDDYYADL